MAEGARGADAAIAGMGRVSWVLGVRAGGDAAPSLPPRTAAFLVCSAPQRCGASPGHSNGAESGLIPLCTLQEWADVCCRGLRSVHAYILVYDICCFDSFEYIKTIRQQILETR